jgi:hypothetical protein
MLLSKKEQGSLRKAWVPTEKKDVNQLGPELCYFPFRDELGKEGETLTQATIMIGGWLNERGTSRNTKK